MANMMTNNSQKKGMFGNMANHIIRRMEKNAYADETNAATYQGIVSKTAFFLAATLVGFLLILIVHNLFANPDLHITDTEKGIYDFTTSGPELILMVIACLVSIIVPFLSWFVRKSIPVVGTIYCLAQGIFIGTFTVMLAPEYKWLSFLAAVLTLALVAVMLFVYTRRIITLTNRMKGVIVTIFATIVVGGILVFILNLIPGVNKMMTGINMIMANPAFSIILSIVFVAIAALFMLADFDTIERCVENKMDREYEWMAAWGLVYSILYIYFKILRIILIIAGNSKSSSSSKKSF